MDRRRRIKLTDVGICVALLAYSVPPSLDASVNDPRATVAGPLLLPTLMLPLLWRRRHPLGAACGFAAGCVVSGAPTFNQFRLVVAIPAALLILYPLATACSRRRALAGLAIVLAGLAFVGATESVLDGVGGTAAMLGYSAPLCIAVWGVGRAVRAREQLAGQLRERSEQLHLQREATAALAVEIDRARLASDLDVAARSRLQEMIDLASAGASEPDGARARFASIELLGRESLDQMRALLGLLRSVDPGARAPRPTLEQLDALIADARAGGRLVELAVEGEQRPLAAAIELAAFRTVQHALLAVESASGQPANVRLRYLSDQLELEVRGLVSDGSAAAAAVMAARERVTSLGGSFSADAPAGGRRVLRARLPLVAAGA
jgi:signal transduction histidine kinase